MKFLKIRSLLQPTAWKKFHFFFLLDIILSIAKEQRSLGTYQEVCIICNF